jgi:hypothetical protein
MTRAALMLSISLLLAPLALGCGSSSPAGPAGGPVPDAADQHCTVNGALAPRHVGICLAPGAETDGGADDAGASDDGQAPASDLGETLYNSTGYDDDCKYQVSFTSTPIRRNTDVTFTVTVKTLDPAGVATGADLTPEVFLTEIHPAPNSAVTTKEVPAGSGVYKVGPIVFDAPGLWTVRFHMYEECSDAPEDSPHGHVAFFVDVP